MNDIKTHVTRLDLAQDGVQVGPVVIQKPAGGMHTLRDVLDMPIKYPQGRGIGEHEARGPWSDGGIERDEIDVAIGAHIDLAYAIAAHGRGGRIRAMSGLGDQDLVTRKVIAGRMVGANHGNPGELPLGPGHRRKRDRAHAGHILQHLLQFEEAGQDTLPRRFRRQRMAVREPRELGCDMRGPGVVLHGARTKWIKMRIDGEIPLAQARVMTHHLKLRDLRQGRRRAPQERRRNVSRRCQRTRHLRCVDAPWGTALEDQHARITWRRRWPPHSPAPDRSRRRAPCAGLCSRHRARPPHAR